MRWSSARSLPEPDGGIAFELPLRVQRGERLAFARGGQGGRRGAGCIEGKSGPLAHFIEARFRMPRLQREPAVALHEHRDGCDDAMHAAPRCDEIELVDERSLRMLRAPR